MTDGNSQPCAQCQHDKHIGSDCVVAECRCSAATAAKADGDKIRGLRLFPWGLFDGPYSQVPDSFAVVGECFSGDLSFAEKKRNLLAALRMERDHKANMTEIECVMAAAEAWGPPAEYGCQKYAPGSWKTVPDALNRYADAFFRHKFAVLRGHVINQKDGGVKHQDQAIWCLVACLWLVANNEEPDSE